jgi:hypothetical protein
MSSSGVIRNQKDFKKTRLIPEHLKLQGDSTTDSDKASDKQNDGQDSEGVKNEGLLRLAELSLEDYEWRQSLFKTNEADRKVEESLARMMGEEATYVRPMDASVEKIGPLVSFSNSDCTKYTAVYSSTDRDILFVTLKNRDYLKSHLLTG